VVSLRVPLDGSVTPNSDRNADTCLGTYLSRGWENHVDKIIYRIVPRPEVTHIDCRKSENIQFNHEKLCHYSIGVAFLVYGLCSMYNTSLSDLRVRSSTSAPSAPWEPTCTAGYTARTGQNTSTSLPARTVAKLRRPSRSIWTSRPMVWPMLRV
jgi:hypothetical protein